MSLDLRQDTLRWARPCSYFALMSRHARHLPHMHTKASGPGTVQFILSEPIERTRGWAIWAQQEQRGVLRIGKYCILKQNCFTADLLLCLFVGLSFQLIRNEQLMVMHVSASPCMDLTATSLIQLAIYYGAVWLPVCRDGVLRALSRQLPGLIGRMCTHMCPSLRVLSLLRVRNHQI